MGLERCSGIPGGQAHFNIQLDVAPPRESHNINNIVVSFQASVKNVAFSRQLSAEKIVIPEESSGFQLRFKSLKQIDSGNRLEIIFLWVCPK